MKEGLKNWLVIFALVIVSALIVNFAFLNKQERKESDEVLGVQEENYKYAPYIISVAPIYVYVNDNFEYNIVVSDLDSKKENLEYSLIDHPDWMYMEGSRIYGVPQESGTYKYVVRVSDGVNSTSQVNYILVENEE
jgi:hypothetical protein